MKQVMVLFKRLYALSQMTSKLYAFVLFLHLVHCSSSLSASYSSHDLSRSLSSPSTTSGDEVSRTEVRALTE